MPIRPEIALAFQQPQIESPLNAFAKYAAIQNAQNQNALAQYQLSSAQRQDAQQNALNDAYRGAIGADGQIDYRALTARLAGAGAGAAIPGVEHARLQNMTAQATLDKTQAETRAKQMTEFAHGMMAVYDDPSDDFVVAASQRLIASGAIPKFVNAQAQQFLSIADPAQRKEAVFKIAMSSPEARAAIEAVQPKWTERGDGASKWLEDTNPMSRTVGQRRSVAQEQVPPAALLSSETARRGQDISASTAIRGQDISAAVQREGHAITAGKQAGERTTELRKEFNALPAVKSYGEVQPVLQSAREALSTDTAAADLNLIYAAAKIFDPTSVVRESETNMVVQAGSPAQRFMGQWNYVAGGGRLTADARKQLMGEIESRARGYESAYNASRKTYEGIADKSGVPRDQVFVDPFAVTSPAPAPKAALKAEAKSEAPKIPKAGDVIDGWKFKGGNPADKKNWEKA